MRCLRVGLSCAIAAAGCGRVGFDARGDGGAAGSGDAGGSGDAAGDPGMVAVPVVAAPFDFEVGTPWKQATLTRSFALDRDEVTVGRWQAFVDAGMPMPADGAALDPTGHYPTMVWHSVWDANAQDRTGFQAECFSPWSINGSTYTTGNPALPMTCVTWMQAVAFCAWDGAKRLPTALEYNYEARGGTGGVGDHRPYVWGTAAPDCAHATSDDTPTPFCAWPVPIGTASAGASAHGALDLNGSVWEFGWDATAHASLEATSDDVPAGAVDYVGMDLGTGETVAHVLFGGEWGEMQDNLNLVAGNNHAPGVAWNANARITTTGIRCARTLP